MAETAVIFRPKMCIMNYVYGNYSSGLLSQPFVLRADCDCSLAVWGTSFHRRRRCRYWNRSAAGCKRAPSLCLNSEQHARQSVFSGDVMAFDGSVRGQRMHRNGVWWVWSGRSVGLYRLHSHPARCLHTFCHSTPSESETDLGRPAGHGETRKWLVV